MQGEVFKKAVGDYNHFISDSDLLDEYEKREIFLSRQSAMNNYERQEGRADGQRGAKLEIAKKLLEQGLTIKQVASATSLTEKEIKAINF